MQYVKHDFHNNFLKAAKSGDKKLASDILAYELVELTTNSPSLVIAALQKHGIKIERKANAKEIISKVTSNIDDSDFSKDLVMLISRGNRYSNEDGEGETAGSAAGKIGRGAASGGVVGAVAGAVDSIFGFLKSGKEKKTSAAHDQATLQQQALAMLAAKKAKKGISGTTIAVIVISSVAIIGLITFLIVRKK